MVWTVQQGDIPFFRAINTAQTNRLPQMMPSSAPVVEITPNSCRPEQTCIENATLPPPNRFKKNGVRICIADTESIQQAVEYKRILRHEIAKTLNQDSSRSPSPTLILDDWKQIIDFCSPDHRIDARECDALQRNWNPNQISNKVSFNKNVFTEDI